jgi:hypothetical protein
MKLFVILIIITFILLLFILLIWYFKPTKLIQNSNIYSIPLPDKPSKIHNKTPSIKLNLFNGICSFDYDGTIDYNDNDPLEAANVCRKNNFAIIGITAGYGPLREQNYKRKLGVKDGDYWFYADKEIKKGPILTKVVNDLKNKGHPIKCVLHFDDAGCNNHFSEYDSINKNSLFFNAFNHSVLNENKGYCIFQNSCDKNYQINADMVEFSIKNCNPKNTKFPIKYSIKSPNDKKYPFLQCQ